ncbi:hypothetical protein SDC9_204792 [bioreactor metagenome]|uniref:Uncharacterized protein n=1 Tax=bioreactor metagenome TaxID=1076179 RepID=A0A645J094_9ZZZZ
MAGQHNRLTGLLKFPNQFSDLLHSLLVQSVERLVKDQYIRIFHYGLGDSQTLLHSQRVFRNRLLG